MHARAGAPGASSIIGSSSISSTSMGSGALSAACLALAALTCAAACRAPCRCNLRFPRFGIIEYHARTLQWSHYKSNAVTVQVPSYPEERSPLWVVGALQ